MPCRSNNTLKQSYGWRPPRAPGGKNHKKIQTFGEFVFLYVIAEGCYHFMRLFFTERSGKPPPAKAADFFRSLFIYMSIGFNQQVPAPDLSLRTRLRCKFALAKSKIWTLT